MTKTNSKGKCFRNPICLGEGGPLVRKLKPKSPGTPRGGWAQSSRAMQFMQGGMGLIPYPILD